MHAVELWNCGSGLVDGPRAIQAPLVGNDVARGEQLFGLLNGAPVLSSNLRVSGQPLGDCLAKLLNFSFANLCCYTKVVTNEIQPYQQQSRLTKIYPGVPTDTNNGKGYSCGQSGLHFPYGDNSPILHHHARTRSGRLVMTLELVG